jgi:hypothetical protein
MAAAGRSRLAKSSQFSIAALSAQMIVVSGDLLRLVFQI